MKYLIVKGACGFGDRMESLKMCVKYALKFNLQIYVDWTDNIWSHSGETFYTYFNLINIPVLKSIDDIPKDATVFPPQWKGNLKESYNTFGAIPTELALNYIDNQPFNADVVVYTCNGYRWIYGDSSFFANVFRLVDQRVIHKVKERQRLYDLKNKIGIHLRGTDRATQIDKSHRMSGITVRMVSAGLLNGAQFIGVSDDTEFVRLWKAKFKTFPILTDLKNLGGNEGVHNKEKNSLEVSKDSLNVELLVDFFTLASCKAVISTSKDSRFANESMKFHHYLPAIGL
jgi:hypothetical protein